ncbi:MAG: carboxypeptidase M32 [Candidatus Marsarchaeota archaeon]|nr:carboxypeptidase M32 [Candidatus Marsarchaeota archaeon]
MAHFNNPVIKRILKKYMAQSAINYAKNILYWDLETYMPKDSLKSRGIVNSELSLIYQKLFLSNEFKNLISKANKIDDLNEYEKGIVRNLNRNLKLMSLPSKFIKAESILGMKAHGAWLEARQKSNFKIFAPYLADIIEMQKDKAEKLGYDDQPYDALLDIHEEGMSTAKLDKIFYYLLPRLRKISNSIEQDSMFLKNQRLEHIHYNKVRMKKLNEDLLKFIGMDFNKFRIDISVHPMTVDADLNDVRITTRYEGVDFKKSMFFTIHEAGHAIYSLQEDSELNMTPLQKSPPLGIHESQSRFLENMIGRSKEFVHAIMPMLKHNLIFLKNYSEKDIYFYFNHIQKGQIRVNADELNYNFHIALRYELEKMMVNETANVNELPEIWNSKMSKYLGLLPRNDSEGILQDPQWISRFGYFPDYTLGNILAAMILYHARRDIKDFDEGIRSGNFKDIKEYLRNKIHRFGNTYAPEKLLNNSFGEYYNPKYLVQYLEEKYIQ